MDFEQLFSEPLFNLGELVINLGQLLRIILVLGALFTVAWIAIGRVLPAFLDREDADRRDRRRIIRVMIYSLSLLAILVLLSILQLDYELYSREGEWENGKEYSIVLSISTLVVALLVFQLARLLNWGIGLLLKARQDRMQDTDRPSFQYTHRVNSQQTNNFVKPVVYLLALMFFISSVGLNFMFRLGFSKQGDDLFISLNDILTALLIVLVFRLIIWVITHLILSNYYRSKQVDIGSQYAINRLLAYFLYVIAILSALAELGINLTVLWGGAAALLVGVGLGLQQTFNDLICGIILLFERTVEVGDVVDINGLVGSVKRIGIRVSLVETRDQIVVIVPNSKLVGENVVNWSHLERRARFHIDIGVAYGSDTEKVRTLLVEVANNHNKILKNPPPFVRFVNFGDSSLDFQLHFWSREFVRIEDVKSDLRFAIDARFREADVVIPFPQRDLWIRNQEIGTTKTDDSAPEAEGEK